MKAVLLVLVASVLLGAQTPPRERRLQEKLVATCCWNESIAFHRSETAAEMRAELKGMIDAGLSDEQILARFREKYSARVLIEPQGGTSTLIYAVPAALTILGGIGLAWMIRRWARAGSVHAHS
jgi:cytochrome c-type biogenesis protein CcmH